MVQSTHTAKIRNITNLGMSDNKKGFLEQYGGQIDPNNPDADESDDGTYKALKQYRGKKGARFHIIDHRGHIFGCGYAYLLGWYYSPPDTLSIYTTAQQFILSGEGMEIIEQAFLREAVMELREFNPQKDILPETKQGDTKPPIIRGIMIDTTFKE